MNRDAVEEILAGDARAVARAITEIENGDARSDALLQRLFPHSGRALLLGITGPPGAGKSTLVDRAAAALRRRGKTVGIIAVDPTSPFSGGAILGDRIRMQGHHGDPGIFIRSMATRGALGGLARATADVATVLDAAGRDVVMVETVGVGQDEVDVVKLADVTVVLLVPGMGDDVQAIKAGIMEIADIFVINKADRPGVERLEQEIGAMLATAPHGNPEHTLRVAAPGATGANAASAPGATGANAAFPPGAWTPPVVRTVASEGTGIEEMLAQVDRYVEFSRAAGVAGARKTRQWRERLLAMLRERLLRRVVGAAVAEDELNEYAARIAARQVDPYTVVNEVLKKAGL